MTTPFMASSSEISSNWRENFAELFSIVYHASGSAIQDESSRYIILSSGAVRCKVVVNLRGRYHIGGIFVK